MNSEYIIDNDLHIHTFLSKCSSDQEQNKETILKYAKDNCLKVVCITDHVWNNDTFSIPAKFYEGQDYNWIKKSLPLIDDNEVTMLFGCEAEMDIDYNIGINNQMMEDLDFIIVPTTHLHHNQRVNKENLSLHDRAKLWVDRLDALLNKKLPFYKIGIAHLTCYLIASDAFEDHIKIIQMIDDKEYKRLFTKAAILGVGIELNIQIERYSKKQKEIIIHPYQIAKECGCKFYFGSDAHHPKDFAGVIDGFKEVRDLLNLKEDDKFHLVIEKRGV